MLSPVEFEPVDYDLKLQKCVINTNNGRLYRIGLECFGVLLQ